MSLQKLLLAIATTLVFATPTAADEPNRTKVGLLKRSETQLDPTIQGEMLGFVPSTQSTLLALEPNIIEGQLNEESEVLGQDNTYYNSHTFAGSAGEQVTIELVSNDFDAYLLLLDPDGNGVATNDDGGEGDNAALVITLPKSGTYTIIATTYGEGMVGTYQLTWRKATEADITQAQAQNLVDEGRQLYQEGGTESLQGVIEKWEAALRLYRTLDNPAREAVLLNDIGSVYSALGNREAALDYYQQALPLIRAERDRAGEAAVLNNIGRIYDSLGNSETALDYYYQVLSLDRALNNRAGEATTLNNIGLIYNNTGDKETALAYYNQALPLIRAERDRAGEAVTLNNIGVAYDDLGKKETALDYFNQGLAIDRDLGNRAGEATTLNNLGNVYDDLGETESALDYYRQALELYQILGDRAGEAVTLNNIGSVYFILDQKELSLDYYRRALALYQTVGDRAGEATMYQTVGDRAGEATTLNNLGNVYDDLGDKESALDYYRRALALYQTIGDRAGEATTLNNIGLVYHAGEQPETALSYYHQALVGIRAVRDRAGEAATLNNIGFVLESTDQPELALLFFKQSVNTYESLRQEITGLDPDLQQTYAQTLADTYKKLAQLLLSQDRVLEAQRVLDLLKLQELDDYLRNLRGSTDSQQGIELLAGERQIWATFDPNTPDFDLRLWSQRPEVTALVAELQRQTQAQQLDLAYVDSLRNFLAPLGQQTALLYPLILDERLELILITANGEPSRHTVPLSRRDLNQTILNLRRALTDRRRPANQTAQIAYDRLFAPLEADLARLGIETLIYAPDGPLRYLPLAALYDGEQWLVERFQINNITAATLMDFEVASTVEVNVIAAGFADTETAYEFTIGDNRYNFSGLDFADDEVSSIAATIPQTTPYLDTQFSKEIVEGFNQHNIVHLATHAEFIPGYPGESFILFGDGSRATLREVEDWNLKNVDLVVLSACQTASGLVGNGEEILGLGYQMQRAGAEATIATLWSVWDESTQVLMGEFYQQLGNQQSKIEALRQAQLALIQEDTFNHPYYWSPFILIGNGL